MRSGPRRALARRILPAIFAVALLAPARETAAQADRLGYQWVDGQEGVPAGDIKRTVGVTVGAIIGGLVILGWLLRARD